MLHRVLNRLLGALGAFSRSQDGNVAMIFGLLLIPIVGTIGAAVDYSRANSVRSAMQAALDATALLLSKDASSINAKELARRANEYFEAELGRPEARNIKVTPAYSGKKGGESTLKVAGSAVVGTTFMSLLGITELSVNATSEVSWGIRKLEVVLALDNTGSMADYGKIEALKVASHQFIDIVAGATRNQKEVKVAIVPFDTRVNVGAGFAAQPWFDWSTMAGGSGGSTAAGGGTTTGSSAGGGGGAGWTGCVMDRTQDYDIQTTKPKPATPATLYPAVSGCNLATMLPLTNNWSALDAKIDEMKASGNTNTTIGFTWAWNMLTPGVPISAAAQSAPNLDRVIVFMTDGMNTQNRWSSNAAEIDARTKLVCNNIKSAGVKIYTIRVMDGNASLLQNCASDPSMYFEVSQANDMIAVFAKIASSVSGLRISR